MTMNIGYSIRNTCKDTTILWVHLAMTEMAKWSWTVGYYIFCARHRMHLSQVIAEWTDHLPTTGGIPKLVRVAGMSLASPFPYINWVNLLIWYRPFHSYCMCDTLFSHCLHLLSIELKKAFQLQQLKAFQALTNFS